MKKLTNNKLLFALIILLLGFLAGRLIKPSNDKADPADHRHVKASDHETWTCSMHPQIRQEEPGKCPLCGMDLIPVSGADAENSGNARVFEMSPEAVAIANVHTSEVKYAVPEKTLHLTGKIAINEQNLATVSSKFSGRIEKLSVNFTGQKIQPGQRLASIYSPELIAAQKELLEAKKSLEIYPELYEAAKQKLKNWKITEQQIAMIEKTGEIKTNFPVVSYSSGIVTKRFVADGDYINTGTPLFEVAGLTNVWVLLDVYESDLAFVNEGSAVTFTVSALPGETFQADINFIDPVIDPQTRVAQIRAVVTNKSMKLKPEMFVKATLHSKLNVDTGTIVIPKKSLLWTGKRSIVYVKAPGTAVPSFEMREITLGAALGEMYVVKSGLTAGEEIVTHGAFTVDAAAQLNGHYSMMNTPGMVQNVSLHDHGSGENISQSKPEIMVKGNIKPAFSSLIDEYINLKNALVAAKHTSAKTSAEALHSIIMSVPMDALDAKGHALWMKHFDALKRSSAAIVASANIDDARKHFVALSESITGLYSRIAGLEKTLYIQHCPMADNDRGANWISLEKEIRNPYYGDMMLTCGEVTGTIR